MNRRDVNSETGPAWQQSALAPTSGRAEPGIAISLPTRKLALKKVAPEGIAMKLENLPIGAIDWSCVSPVVEAGETGTAASRIQNLGDITLRVVAYSGGFAGNHWCAKGHIVYVISGNLIIEHEDGSRTALCAGMTWHTPDDQAATHRVRCESGATVFIVD